MFPGVKEGRINRRKDVVLVFEGTCYYWFLGLICRSRKPVVSSIILASELSLKAIKGRLILLFDDVIDAMLVLVLLLLSSLPT